MFLKKIHFVKKRERKGKETEPLPKEHSSVPAPADMSEVLTTHQGVSSTFPHFLEAPDKYLTTHLMSSGLMPPSAGFLPLMTPSLLVLAL